MHPKIKSDIYYILFFGSLPFFVEPLVFGRPQFSAVSVCSSLANLFIYFVVIRYLEIYWETRDKKKLRIVRRTEEPDDDDGPKAS